MSVPTTSPRPIETLAELVTNLGGVPLDRIRFHPFPGTATERDALSPPQGEKRLYELVDGVLVEKAMGFNESRLAAVLIYLLERFLEDKPLGIVLGADGMLRLAPGCIRIPDVSVFLWEKFPGRRPPAAPVPDVAPDLAVEILSDSNTPAEMARKRREYFGAGVRLVWELDPRANTLCVYTSPDACISYSEDSTVEAGPVLPGFRISIREWSARAWSGEIAQDC